MTTDKVARTWFSDEKVFTVQTLTNTQNDRVYATVSAKRVVPPEWLLKGRKHFSQCYGVRGSVQTWQDVAEVCPTGSKDQQHILL